MLDPRGLSQIGLVETKLSINNALQIRDPTGDKRVVDFCYGIPEEQYFNQNYDRSLIRRSMQGFLPDKVRLNQSVRGYQSADWIQRIQPSWGNITMNLEMMFQNESFRKFLDIDEIKRAIDLVGKDLNDRNTDYIYVLIVCYITGMFFGVE